MKLKRISRGDRALDIFLYIMLTLVIIICAYPVYFILLASVSNSTFVNSGELLWYPKGFHLEGFKFVFQNDKLLVGYGNTIFYTVCGTVLGLFCSLTAGYSLSRKDLPGHGIIMFLMVFTMYFSGGLIPTYLVVNSLGLLNTRAILVIVGSVSVYNIILIRTFFLSNIPAELHEAASIYGCGNIRFFVTVVLPLSSAIIAVIALYLAVGYWNSYFTALIYVADRSKSPLQIYLREILMAEQSVSSIGDGELAGQYMQMLQVVKYAVIVVATLPILCIYPFLQKYFVKGVMVGAIKG